MPGRNDKGLVTYDRKIKKDAFYFYQANWSDEPMVYITSRRFTERTNAVTDVKIYSNAGKVELLLNGTSQGKRADGTNGVFIWKDVQLKPGENRVEARAERDGKKLNDSCVWTFEMNRAPEPKDEISPGLLRKTGGPDPAGSIPLAKIFLTARASIVAS